MASDLTRDEGSRNKPYRDSRGFLTIGVGHNLDEEGLCEEAIQAQLAYDIRTKALPLYESLPWLHDAPESVQRALLNMAYNLGVGGLLKWTTFLPLVKARDYEKAAAQLLSNRRYVSQVKSRATRIAELILSAA